MTTLEYIIGAILFVLAVALVVFISLQQSKRHGLGNSIAGQGASESYLTRNKIATKEKKWQKITLIMAIAFVVIVLALFIIYTSGNADTSSVASAVSTVAE